MSRLEAKLAVVLWSVAVLGSAAAETSADRNLYQSSAIVTGQDPARHDPGLVTCYRRVLVKVSGDARLLQEGSFNSDIARIKSSVTEISLHDRLWYKPVHDEQGTRDRPYDLTATFDPSKIDRALAELGRTPWLQDRPALLIIVHVTNGQKSFWLSGDDSQHSGMVEALADAADRFGMAEFLPLKEQFSISGLDRAGDHTNLELAKSIKGARGEIPLVGSLTYSELDPGWLAEWQLSVNGRSQAWRSRGTNFDEAFRVAIGGAAQLLSGNGKP